MARTNAGSSKASLTMARSDRGRGRPRGADVDELIEALGQLYGELDAAQEGATCPASTECCRFARTRREPWVTRLEVIALERARKQSTPSRGRPAPLSLPLFDPMKDEGLCPVLGADGRCTAYAWRPFGCRTFFCDRASVPFPLPHRDMLGYVRRIKELAERMDEPDAAEGRPLRRALAR